ncbi:MAG: NnrS family protein, partial [Reinekea sp.]|nr:NnrS family protein [Reinekea sp.]
EMTAPQQVTQWARFSVLVVILLIVIFGGRVIPFFTASGLGVTKALPILWLERALMITQALATLLLPFAPEAAVVRGLALVIAVLHVLRWIRWQHWALWQKPLLWSLHLAYFNIALGWLAIGLLGLNSVTLHALAIGGIGLMILAFAGRVSLAHSGRALKPSPIFAITLLFVTAAVIFRVWIPLLFNVDSVSLRYIASGIFWATGYAVFTAIYFRIWFSPRSVGH